MKRKRFATYVPQCKKNIFICSSLNPLLTLNGVLSWPHRQWSLMWLSLRNLLQEPWTWQGNGRTTLSTMNHFHEHSLTIVSNLDPTFVEGQRKEPAGWLETSQRLWSWRQHTLLHNPRSKGPHQHRIFLFPPARRTLKWLFYFPIGKSAPTTNFHWIPSFHLGDRTSYLH